MALLKDLLRIENSLDAATGWGDAPPAGPGGEDSTTTGASASASVGAGAAGAASSGVARSKGASAGRSRAGRRPVGDAAGGGSDASSSAAVAGTAAQPPAVAQATAFAPKGGIGWLKARLDSAGVSSPSLAALAPSAAVSSLRSAASPSADMSVIATDSVPATGGAASDPTVSSPLAETNAAGGGAPPQSSAAGSAASVPANLGWLKARLDAAGIQPQLPAPPAAVAALNPTPAPAAAAAPLAPEPIAQPVLATPAAEGPRTAPASAAQNRIFSKALKGVSGGDGGRGQAQPPLPPLPPQSTSAGSVSAASGEPLSAPNTAVIVRTSAAPADDGAASVLAAAATAAAATLSAADTERRQSERLLSDLRRRAQDPAWRRMQEGRAKLPAAEMRGDVLGAINQGQCSVIAGATGCGKTTQVPQFILDEAIEAGRGGAVRIIVTQPRRLSAISVAERIANERCERLGDTVGYSIRFESKAGPNTRLLFCTTGILLRRLQSDPELQGVTHVMVDEVHERDLNSDFVLIILRDLAARRPGLRVVAMSATVDAGADPPLSWTPPGHCPLPRHTPRRVQLQFTVIAPQLIPPSRHHSAFRRPPHSPRRLARPCRPFRPLLHLPRPGRLPGGRDPWPDVSGRGISPRGCDRGDRVRFGHLESIAHCKLWRRQPCAVKLFAAV